MQKRALLSSVAALASLMAFATPVFADAVSDGLAKAKENLAPYSAKPRVRGRRATPSMPRPARPARR